MKWLFKGLDDPTFNRWGHRVSSVASYLSFATLGLIIWTIISEANRWLVWDERVKFWMFSAWAFYLLPMAVFFGERVRRDFEHHRARMEASDALFDEVDEGYRRSLREYRESLGLLPDKPVQH